MEIAEANAAWKYKVICDDGAFVRTGLELSSRHLYTVPRTTVVEVLERRVNNQGLARLRIGDGWISEMLNPLSGQVRHKTWTYHPFLLPTPSPMD